ASGHAAAAPPSSVMNWRRSMPDIGVLPPWCRSVYRTLNLPQRGRQVLGTDLNCSESMWGAADLLPCRHPNNSTQHASLAPGSAWALVLEPTAGAIATMAAANKCLAKSNKSCTGREATKNRFAQLMGIG